MTEEKPIWEGKMHPAEFRAYLYELPAMLVALLLGAVVGWLYAFVVNRFLLFLIPNLPLLLLLGLVLIGLIFTFWGASYYPRRVLVFSDRLRFIMLFGRREVPLKNIVACERLEPEKIRATFFSLRFANLTAAVSNAILLKRNRGRVWVFSLREPEKFLEVMRTLIPEKVKGLAKEPTPPSPAETQGPPAASS